MSVVITAEDIARFLRDAVDNNLLLDALQFTGDDLMAAVSFAVDEFNAITPMTTYTPTNFPNRWLLLMGTAAHLMTSEAFLQLRNQATYNDGDIERIGIDDKTDAYQKLAARLKVEWKSTAQKMKQQINLENAYGSLASGYAGTVWRRNG